MERNITLDYFKILFSILIITIHILYTYQPGQFYIGWYIPEGIARMGVPFFFLVNGYYFARKINNRKAIKKYIIHLFIIYTTWFIIYLRPYIYKYGAFDLPNNFRIDIFFKDYFFGYFHLWYLPVLIYSIILLILLNKIIKKESIIIIISIILYIFGYILESIEVDYNIFRGPLFFGLPFVAIGYCIRNINIKKIKDKHLIISFILLLTCLLIESTYAQSILFMRNLYISLIFLVPVIFILILKHSTYKLPGKHYEYIGSLSSAIYFCHYYINFISGTFLFEISYIDRILFVTFVSILASIFIIFINKRIKIFL